MKVVFSERASAVSRTNIPLLPRAGANVVRQIRIALKTIADYPQAGAVLPAASGVRRFVAPPCHVDDVVRDEVVLVVAIRHGRQAAIEPDVDQDDFEV